MLQRFVICILLLLPLGAMQVHAQGFDCNCANTKDPQLYLTKVNNGENVQVCSECAALALYLCICDCKTTHMTRAQIEAGIKITLSNLEGYEKLGNNVCCPLLIKSAKNKNDCHNAGTTAGNGTNSNDDCAKYNALVREGNELYKMGFYTAALNKYYLAYSLASSLSSSCIKTGGDLDQLIADAKDKRDNPGTKVAKKKATGGYNNDMPTLVFEDWIKRLRSLIDAMCNELKREIEKISRGGEMPEMSAIELYSRKLSDIYLELTVSKYVLSIEQQNRMYDAIFQFQTCIYNISNSLSNIGNAGTAGGSQTFPAINPPTPIRIDKNSSANPASYQDNNPFQAGSISVPLRQSDPGPPDLKRK